jgi:5-methylcytosine-specific restriction enzyme subunit McrC
MLSDHDRRLAGVLGRQGRLVVEELRSGLRVQTRAWVGVVRFETLEVRVSPKLAGDALGVAGMLAFTRGTEALRRSTGVQHLGTAETTDLLELLALLLAEATERVVRSGLFSGYHEREEDLTTVRGRLLVDRQLLERFGSVDRVYCRFDELEHDTDENRLLALTLQLCSRRVQRDGLHRRLRYLAALFAEICSPELLDIERARATLAYDRQNAHYREAHELAWLILDGFGVRDLLATSAPTRSFAFLLDMNALFEEFIWRLVERLFPAPAYRVEPQEQNWSVLWDVAANRSYRSIRPDVVVRRRDGAQPCAVIDAKYKRYDVIDVSSADVYQGFLYAQAYAATGSGTPPTGLLIYPSERDEVQSETIRLRRSGRERAADLVAFGLPVRTTLEHLHDADASPSSRLRSVIGKALDNG